MRPEQQRERRKGDLRLRRISSTRRDLEALEIPPFRLSLFPYSATMAGNRLAVCLEKPPSLPLDRSPAHASAERRAALHLDEVGVQEGACVFAFATLDEAAARVGARRVLDG